MRIHYQKIDPGSTSINAESTKHGSHEEIRMDPISPNPSRVKDVSEDGRDTGGQPFWQKGINKARAFWEDDRLRSLTVRQRVYLFISVIMLLLLSVLLAIGVFIGRSHCTVDVDLGYAKYRGTCSNHTQVSQWLGMRYAEPPLGNLRFRAAVDPLEDLSTTEVQMATQNQPVCLATNVTKLNSNTSEDCLYVNVFAPSARKKLLPVYVFIQGGGFNHDGNADYDGSGLIIASGYEIVVVTFNYRVGPYGFLTSKEVEADGDLNIGLKDQRKVFEWVQKYITRFGGNPDQVTIGGDSAGGASVDLHLSAYGGRDDGLFHAAAAESQSFGTQLNISESQYQYDALVERAYCSSANDTLSCLRGLSTAALQALNLPIPYPGHDVAPLYGYSSVIDGDFIQESTYEAFQKGKFIKVPVIFGDTSNEGTLFAPNQTSDYVQMNKFLSDNFPNITSDQLAEIDKLYPEAEHFPDTGPFWRTAANAYGEMRYNCPGIFISSAYNNASVPTNNNDSVPRNWLYHYDVVDPKRAASGLGVSHTIEVTAIWGGPPYVPEGTPESYSTSLNKHIIPIMQGYWTSFIRAHDPNTYRLPGTPVWERFTSQGMERILFRTNATTMEVVPDAQRERCAYLSSIGVDTQQ